MKPAALGLWGLRGSFHTVNEEEFHQEQLKYRVPDNNAHH